MFIPKKVHVKLMFFLYHCLVSEWRVFFCPVLFVVPCSAMQSLLCKPAACLRPSTFLVTFQGSSRSPGSGRPLPEAAAFPTNQSLLKTQIGRWLQRAGTFQGGGDFWDFLTQLSIDQVLFWGAHLVLSISGWLCHVSKLPTWISLCLED